MKLVKTSLQLVGARTFILWFPALIGLVFCIINIYNPLSSILLGLSSVTKANIFDTVISFLQIVLDSAYLPLAAAAAAAIAVVAAFVGSFLMSGYFNILNNVLSGKPKVPGEFISGVKKSFRRLLKVNLVTFFTGLLVIVFLLIASVPSVVISKAAYTDRPDLIAAAIFVDILTVGAVVFGLLFFTSYTLFWYPAVLNLRRKPFSGARKVVNAGFFDIAGRLLLFCIFLAAVNFILIEFKGSLLTVILEWLFNTIFFVLLSVFVFKKFITGIKTAGVQE